MFLVCRKITGDVAVMMSSGSEFHNLAPMTGKVWSPSVERSGLGLCARNIRR